MEIALSAYLIFISVRFIASLSGRKHRLWESETHAADVWSIMYGNINTALTF